MKKFLLIAVLSLLSLFLVGCGDKNESNVKSNSKDKVLKVGMELAYPPFEMSNKKGEPVGISVDFAKSLGAYLGRDVVIENIAWDGLIPSLKTGKIDLIISSMTITKERKKSIDFSIPYAQSSLAILANKNSDVQSIKDLNKMGMVVAVKKGTTGHIYAKMHLQKADILVFDKEAACVLEVTQRKADAFLYDQLTVYRNYMKHQDTTKLLLKTFEKDVQYWGVALKKDNPLKLQVNKFIEKAKKDGTFDTLANKYLKDAKEKFDELGIPFFF